MSNDGNVDSAVRRIAAPLLVTGVVNIILCAAMIARGYPLALGHPEAFRDLQRAMTWSDAYVSLAQVKESPHVVTSLHDFAVE